MTGPASIVNVGISGGRTLQSSFGLSFRADVPCAMIYEYYVAGNHTSTMNDGFGITGLKQHADTIINSYCRPEMWGARLCALLAPIGLVI